MRYALLAYANTDEIDSSSPERRRQVNEQINDVLHRPGVTGWLRLHDTESATTVRHDGARTLLTDGPFVDSKDFLGGFIEVDADGLDGALAIAAELQEIRGAGAIEVRPVREDDLLGA